MTLFQRTRGVLQTFALALRDAEKWDESPLIGAQVFLAEPGNSGLSAALEKLAEVAKDSDREKNPQWPTTLKTEMPRVIDAQKAAAATLTGRELEAACVAAFVVLVLMTKIANKGRAYVFAAIAGTCLGLMVIFFDIAGVVGGAGAGKYLTIYWLIGFMCGNCAFVFTNLAFFSGSATMVVPTVNSFMIIMPMIFEIFIFRVSLQPIQYLGAAIIVAGVIILTTGEGHVQELQPQAA